jgi:hypothetical protein
MRLSVSLACSIHLTYEYVGCDDCSLDKIPYAKASKQRQPSPTTSHDSQHNAHRRNTWFSSVIRANSRRRTARFIVVTYRTGSLYTVGSREFRMRDIFDNKMWFSRSISEYFSDHAICTPSNERTEIAIFQIERTYRPKSAPFSDSGRCALDERAVCCQFGISSVRASSGAAHTPRDPFSRCKFGSRTGSLSAGRTFPRQCCRATVAGCPLVVLFVTFGRRAPWIQAMRRNPRSLLVHLEY